MRGLEFGGLEVLLRKIYKPKARGRGARGSSGLASATGLEAEKTGTVRDSPAAPVELGGSSGLASATGPEGREDKDGARFSCCPG